MKQNRRVSFIFNIYDQNGRLVPARESRYEVNPYYVVKYGARYYLLASHGNTEKTYIYRLDLMTDAELIEEERTSVRKIKELRHSSAIEYMERHLRMNYDEPRTVTVRNSDCVEIIRPKSARRKILEKAEILLQKYQE